MAGLFVVAGIVLPVAKTAPVESGKPFEKTRVGGPLDRT